MGYNECSRKWGAVLSFFFKKGPEFSFNVLVRKSQESDKWLAICLELDIITEGKTGHEAEKNLQDSVKMYLESVLEDGDFSSLRRPAPAEYWEHWAKIQNLQHTKPRANFNFVNA